MNENDYIIGVDGGNTNIRVVAVASDGTVLGAGRSGCGDIRRGQNMDTAIQSWQAAKAQALDQAGSPSFDDCGAYVFSMAGVDWPEDAKDFVERLRGTGLAGQLTVTNDGISAVYAGCPAALIENCGHPYGVAVALGTYATTAAISRDGQHQWHSGYFQWGGGATGLGHAAFDAVLHAHLGMTPPTVLTAKVLAYFGLTDVEALLHAFTSRTMPRPAKPIDHLAKLVLDAAHAGDAAALEIVRSEALKLSATAIAAAKKVGWSAGDKLPFTLMGGVLCHWTNLLPNLIRDQFLEQFPNALPRVGGVQPIEGVAVMGLLALGVRITPAIRQRIERTLAEALLRLI